MLTEEQMNLYADIFQERFSNINIKILEDIGKTLKKTGDLTPSQAKKLQQMYSYGEGLDSITRQLSSASGKSLKDIEKLYEQIAKDELEWSKPFYDAKGITQLPLKDNKELLNIIKSAVTVTSGQLKNISKTTTVGIVTSKGFEPLSKFYKDTIDNAITAVATGVLDYNSVIRQSVKDMGRSGLRVKYESGYTKRLDSAIRQNVLDGVSYVAQEISRQNGKEFGADGVELSSHSPCAPDHLPFQGQQFSLKEFEKVQLMPRKFGVLGCHHNIYFIILGISKPARSKEELREMQRHSNEPIEIDGKEYTRYDCSQIQRNLETKMRYVRDEKVLYSVVDDKELILNANTKLRQLTQKYVELSKKADLPTRLERGKIFSQKGGKKVELNPGGSIIREKVIFKPSATIKEAEDFAKNSLGIKNVSYKGLDIATANAWNEGLQDTFNRFPELKKSFGFVGEAHERNAMLKPVTKQHYLDKLIKRNPQFDIAQLEPYADDLTRKFMKSMQVGKNTIAQSWAPTDKPFSDFRGVSINRDNGKDIKSLLESLKDDVYSQFHPIGCDTVRSVLDHEIGHQLDKLLDIRDNNIIQNLFNNRTHEELTNALSRYSWHNTNPNKYSEMIAEAWAEYCNNPQPREIAQTIGEIIEAEYKKKFG